MKKDTDPPMAERTHGLPMGLPGLSNHRRLIALAWGIVTAAGLGVGGLIAFDTVRTAVSLHSALPWLDDWNTVDLLRDWSLGGTPMLTALSSQFGEHRPFVPRLVLFADDLAFHGQGWLALGAILLVQAGHAALFAALLAKAAVRGAGR